MQKKRTSLPVKCIHHWHLSSDIINGKVKAICLLCGETEMMIASWESISGRTKLTKTSRLNRAKIIQWPYPENARTIIE